MDNLDEIINLLEKEYRYTDFGNKEDPVDELVYIILSKRTNYRCNNITFNRLKQRFPDWNQVLKADQKEIYEIVKYGGLGEEKSINIKKLLQIINEDFGTFDIKDYLLKWKKEDVYNYLISLPGIGPKSAYCTMLYSLKMSVQPADAHVIRLFYRSGYIDHDQERHHSAQKIIAELCEEFPYEKNYKIHIYFKAHGQEVCRQKPYCLKCSISKYCWYYSIQK